MVQDTLTYLQDGGFVALGMAIATALYPKVLDAIEHWLVPNMADVFEEHINPNAAEWIRAAGKDEVRSFIEQAIAIENKRFVFKPARLKKFAISRVLARYDLSVNAGKVQDQPAERTFEEGVDLAL